MGSHSLSATSKSVDGALHTFHGQVKAIQWRSRSRPSAFLTFLRLTLPLVLDFPIPGTGSEHISHSDDTDFLYAVSSVGNGLDKQLLDRADCIPTSSGPIKFADSCLSLPLVTGSSFPEEGSELSSSPDE